MPLARPVDAPAGRGQAQPVRVHVSMLNSASLPPVNVGNSGPVPVPVSDVETVWYVSHPPVTGTATEPSTGPVCEPDRIWIVPPMPPEVTRAEKPVRPTVLTDEYPAQ